MGLIAWVKKVLFPAPTPAAHASEPRRERVREERSATAAAADAPLPKQNSAKAATGAMLRPRVGPLDSDEVVTVVLESPEEDLLWRLSQRIDSGRLDIPVLPPTSVAALAMVNRPSVEVRQLVEAIERDPLIASELLRMANSALYATAAEAASVQQAVMRVGLKSVRNVIFGAAMKSSLGNARRLNEYAEEVWRQAQAVALVARTLSSSAGIDREQGYLVGLLHDLGKIALLGMLQTEMKDMGRLTPALVGRVFRTFHERAGRAMALEWKLPAEIVSVAGCHHDFAANSDHPREAALAKLAHEVDLRLSLRDESGLRALVDSPALAALGIADESARWRTVEAARTSWEAHESGAGS